MKLSIITINLNNAEGLKKTITSVVNQTHKEFEFIVVDGASTDGSENVINANKQYIDTVIIEQDTGIYNAMNKGIANAKGSYLLFLNSGDCFHSVNIVSEVIPYFNTNKEIYYGNLNWITSKDSFVFHYPSHLSAHFLYKTSLPHPASFIKSNLFTKIGAYNENLKLVSDWEFFMKALLKFNVSYKHIPLVITDFDGNGFSNQKAYKQQMKHERAEVMTKHFPLLKETFDVYFKNEQLVSSKQFNTLQKIQKNPFLKKLNQIWFKMVSVFIKK